MSYTITNVKEEKKSVDGTLVGALVLFAWSFIAGAWGAFVLWKLYTWFVLPLGAPPLNWWHIWGLSMFFNIAVMVLWPETPEHTLGQTFVRSLTKVVLLAIILPVGWIISGQIT